MVAKIHGVPYLVGLTIAGYHCGVEDGLYTLVPAQMQWIGRFALLKAVTQLIVLLLLLLLSGMRFLNHEHHMGH